MATTHIQPLATASLAVLIGCGWCHAQETVALPAGRWERSGPSLDHPRMIEIAGEGIRIDQADCRLGTVRAQHAGRWYVDANCGEGSELVQLDLLKVGADRLLVARRPLGAAESYFRLPN